MITSYSATRLGDVTTVTVVSDLSPAPIYYHWYLDGGYLGVSETDSRDIHLAAGQQAQVEVVDTLDPNFDPLADAPPSYPPRRTIEWILSLDVSAVEYRIEQQVDGGAWTAVARVSPHGDTWSLSWITARLTDITTYAWRVVPIDAAGNDGTPIAVDPETIVRVPDAPDFVATFDEVTLTVTVSAP